METKKLTPTLPESSSIDYGELMKNILELTRNISSIAAKKAALIHANFRELHHKYNYSDMHTLDYIGRNRQANVTRIAENLGMTRGAISKIVRRLITNRHILSYRLPDNRKEIYYRLTPEGEALFARHAAIHDRFVAIDSSFFTRYSTEAISEFTGFLRDYDAFLSENSALYTLENKNL